MTLVRFEPLKEFDNINSRLQKFFEDFPSAGNSINPGFSPRINILENEESIGIEVELPGVKKSDINITLEDNILTVKGEKKAGSVDEKTRYYRSERVFGAFKRSFTMPKDVESENVVAKFEDGVLFISLQKVQPKSKTEREITLS